MFLSLGFINLVLLFFLIYMLSKKHKISNFISIIFLIFIIPSILDKLIGSVGLSYGMVYTQFSFIDLIIIFYILKNIHIKIDKQLFTVSLMLFIIMVTIIIIHIFENDQHIKLLIVYSYNYFRIVVFMLFSYIYLKKSYYTNNNDLKKLSLIHILLIIILLVEGFAFQLIMGTDRMALPYLNVNVLPNTLILFYLIFLVLKRTNNYIFLLFLLLILFTESRTALLLLLLLKFFIEERISVKRLLLLLLIFGTLILLNDRLSEIFLNISNFEHIDTIRSRLQIWYGTWSLIENNYLFGIGPGLLYVDKEWTSYLYETFQHRELLLSAHNEFIQQALFLGIIFSTIFFIIIIYLFYKTKRLKLFFPILVMFMINSNIDTIRFDMIFGILIGTMIYMQKFLLYKKLKLTKEILK